ncbi:MAG: hypothetical protein HWE16_16870 [Gammaproteobacteria bacterium]|nr:hypothetical protein [Gammaproteobacteria bacterium]
MKVSLLFSSLTVVLALAGCSNEPKESDKLLSDYKKQQLEKAKQVEAEMNKRVDNINKQLDELEEKQKDDPQ